MVPKRLLNYVLCRRDSLPRLVGERISVEIKARDRSRIGDSASISQRRDRSRGAVAGRMTYFNSLLRVDYAEGGGRLNEVGHEAVVNVVWAHVESALNRVATR